MCSALLGIPELFTFRPFFELRQRVLNIEPARFGTDELMVRGTYIRAFGHRTERNINESRVIGVTCEDGAAADPTESSTQLVRNFI